MKISTDYQVTEHNGAPGAMLAPYADFLAILGEHDNDNETLPHEIVKALVDGYTTIAALRKYRSYDKRYMADQTSISQPSYSQMGARKFFNLRATNRDNLCHILNVKPAHPFYMQAQSGLSL